jgi:LDH2 family malate/lactate/ureidoglycolate dehydrogenase
MDVSLTVAQARALAIAALRSLAFDDDAAAVTADHLVDAALRGVTFGSLPRILSIAERIAQTGDRRRPIGVVRDTPVSALVDGGDHVGYVVAHRATRLAIDKARRSGIAIVGAKDTYYTGLFAYYMEMATREGFAAMAIGNGPGMVAPEGAIDGRLGTNPVAWGFPSTGDPVIWDIGTSAIMHGELQLHRRLGEPLPEGVALDRDGRPTTDPDAADAGAIKAWGGHRGSGLSVVVQMLGAMCDVPVISPGMREMAYLVLVIDPKLLMPDGEYPERVAELAGAIRGARAADPSRPVRLPFERSAAERRRRLAEDRVQVPEPVHRKLTEMALGASR